MVGENFEIYSSEMAENASKPLWLEKILKCTILKWLKIKLVPSAIYEISYVKWHWLSLRLIKGNNVAFCQILPIG